MLVIGPAGVQLNAARHCCIINLSTAAHVTVILNQNCVIPEIMPDTEDLSPWFYFRHGSPSENQTAQN